jgi:hypothetical protein
MLPHPHHTLLIAASTVALLMAGATPATAQDQLVVVEPGHVSMYVNGGVGDDEELYMRNIAKDWPLRMTFSERKDNEFITSVSLLVTDAHGAPYLQLNAAGPMTYAMLPAGKYRIVAQFKGQSETRDVTLDGKSGRDVMFHWKAAPQ